MGKRATILYSSAVLVLVIGSVYRQVHSPVKQRLNESSGSSMTRNWTADVGPYKEVLKRMKAEFQQGKSPQEITQEYKALAQSRPADPVAQLAYIAAQRGQIIAAGKSIQPSLVDALTKADPGNAYEYARYQFCMSDEANIQLPQQEVKTVGDRLLRYDSQDNWSRLSLINLLTNYKTGDVEALPYGLKWIKREPKNEKAHSALGLIYFDMWASGNRKNQALARKSLAEYQAYMRLAPPNDGFRRLAAIYIKHLQQALSG